MIIRSLRWHVPFPRKLLEYVTNEKKRAQLMEPIYHNVREPTVEGAIAQFKENDKYRRKRKNGITMYHEIISFHPEDAKHLTPETLDDISRKFIELRGPEAIVVAQAHLDQEHIHIHLAFTANKYQSRETIRLSNHDFIRIRKEMEEYQLSKYPELNKSVVYLDKDISFHAKSKDQNTRKSKEYHRNRAAQNPSKKETIAMSVHQALQTSKSKEAFFDQLLQKGYLPYEYRGKTNGIIVDGKKYRFSNLGITKEQFQFLDKSEKTEIEKHLQKLESLRKKRDRDKPRER